MTEGSFGRRMTALAAVIAVAFAALVTRLWFLQVLAADQYVDQANSNRVRLVPVPAPRGRILDRNGNPLVTNTQAFVMTIDRSKVEDERALLKDLAAVPGWDVKVKELEARLNDLDYLPYQPVPVYDRTPKKVAVYIETHAEDFPGVDFEVTGLRTYVAYGPQGQAGPLAPHLLGTLGEINQEELNDPSFAGHLPGQLVGRGGVEQYYEDELSGESGWRKIEVDAAGDVLGTIGFQPGTPGNDLMLSLDSDIQQLAQQTLAEAIGAARHNVLDEETLSFVKAPAGSVVVMDPDNGHVVAMASFPTYDPRIFLDEVTQNELNRLYDPRRNYPILNRAVAGQYPPGSIFKPFVAAAALKAGYADMSSTYECPPTFEVPEDTSGTVFHNWTDAHLGYLNLAQSLVQSCDTIYYRFGLDFYSDIDKRGEMMQEQLRRWGFGSETGIDIPGELDGRIPDQDWKQEVNELYPNLFDNAIWFPGDNINMSIGQGDVLTTPLQAATAYSAIANGGTLYRPQAALKIVDPEGKVVKRIKPRRIGHVPANKQTLAFLRQALTGVVQPGGTAASAFINWPHAEYPVAGKTGTSEVTINGVESTHSWFAAMAPADNPEYVVVAVVERGGHGSQVAAPIVRRILEGIFGLDSAGLTIDIAEDQAVD
jgi:penicillin-binding protein 2